MPGMASGSYTPSANGGNSGNPVTFGTSGGNCSYDSTSGKVSFDHAGSCTVTADQAGNSDYNAASQASQTFTIAKADQTITVTTAAPASTSRTRHCCWPACPIPAPTRICRPTWTTGRRRWMPRCNRCSSTASC